jgi:TonB-linked SusC/RagA family outer membrane protein
MKVKLLLLFFSLIATVGFVNAQSPVISGTVSDNENKEVLAGVTVTVKGANNSTQTGTNGEFRLPIPTAKNYTLIFSYLGYATKEVNTGPANNLAVFLDKEDSSLDEVVVIGYGVMKKRDLTGAVSSVKEKDLTAIPTTNALRSLQGKVSGLDITQTSGQPGSDINIVLRGNRSLNADNKPLVLIDGIDYGSFLDINPTDIASVEVLKDVSSTAIYGTRGANGVIIVTTKKGSSSGKTTLSFNSYASINNKSLYPSVMDGDQYARLKREAYRTTNNGEYRNDADIFNATEFEYLNSKQFEDWQSYIFHTGINQNYEVAMRGGNEKTIYSTSFGFQRDKGLLKNDIFKRYNGRLSLDHKITDVFKLGINTIYTFRDQDKRDNPLNMANKILPIAKAFDEDGTLIRYPAPGYNTQFNPLADEVPGEFINNIIDKRLFTSGYLDIKFHEDFLFKSTIGLDIHDFRNGFYRGYNTLANVGRNSRSGHESTNLFKYTWENTLNYNKAIGEHDFTGLVGTSTIKSKFENFEGNGNNQASALTGFYDIGANTASKEIGSFLEEIALVSFFGRVNYKFKDRYLFQASLRGDGSSVLSKGNKWGYFPSVSGAWRITDEDFLSNNEVVNDLKLRASWGKAGNSAIDPYATLGGLSKSAYAFGSSAAFGYWPSGLKNPDLTWETTATWNIGLDFGLLNNRITGMVDVYRSRTSDLLLPSLLPTSTGFASVMQNVGETENKGVEISLTTQNIRAENFTWSTDWTYTLNREKIVALNQGVTRNIANNWIVGEPTQIFYDYNKIGIWQLGEEAAADAFGGYKPGDIKIEDANKNGSSDPDDRIAFSRVPKYSFGLNNNFAYKNLDLTVFVYGRIGQFINYEYNANYKPSALENSSVADFWTPENPTNAFPRPNSGYSTTSYLFQSSLRYVDGSFVKVRDITLGYTLPQPVMNKLSVHRARIYATLQNYFVFSKIDDYDPERGGDLSFPMTKSVVFGVNFDF